MGSVRTAMVPLLAMPVSLVGAAAVMLLLGFSLNLLTILAIVLAVGLVVDDAIVVVENVERHVREGMNRVDAAIVVIPCDGAGRLGPFKCAHPVHFLQRAPEELTAQTINREHAPLLVVIFFRCVSPTARSGRNLFQSTGFRCSRTCSGCGSMFI